MKKPLLSLGITSVQTTETPLQEGKGQGSGKSKNFMGLSVLLDPTLWDIYGTFFCVSQTGVILDEQILKTSKSKIWFCS